MREAKWELEEAEERDTALGKVGSFQLKTLESKQRQELFLICCKELLRLHASSPFRMDVGCLFGCEVLGSPPSSKDIIVQVFDLEDISGTKSY